MIYVMMTMFITKSSAFRVIIKDIVPEYGAERHEGQVH